MQDLINQVGELAIHAHTALPLGEATSMSSAADFFASKSYSNYRSHLEAKQKFALATLGRFDNVTKAIGGLGKLLASIGKRGRF